MTTFIGIGVHDGYSLAFGIFLTPTIVVLNVLLGQTISTMINSLFFVFISHPFDVGDEVEIGNSQYQVNSISIFSTTFTDSRGYRVYFPNSLLSGLSMINVTRSGRTMLAIEAKITVKPPDKLAEDMTFLEREISKITAIPDVRTELLTLGPNHEVSIAFVLSIIDPNIPKGLGELKQLLVDTIVSLLRKRHYLLSNLQVIELMCE